MIFATVGTQLPFDRLIRAVDDWAGAAPGRTVIAQTGRGKYQPRHAEGRTTIEPAEFQRLVQEAEVVVSHAGMGTILSALELGKPIVLLPRLAALGEHRNDHQLATAARFGVRPLVRVAQDEHQIATLLDALCLPGGNGSGEGGISPWAAPEFIARLRDFIDQAVRK